MAGVASPSRGRWLLPGTCSHLWFAGVRECPPWCSIVGATVTVHQFFCILHLCYTCSLCRVELIVQFPRGVRLKCLYARFPGVLWLWHFLYSVGPHPVSNLHIYTFVVSRAFMAGAASQARDADSLPDTWSHIWFAGVRESPSWCSIVGATVTVHQFFCILHCMINRTWGLKELWLQVNGHDWFHLHGIHWSVWNQAGIERLKIKIYVSSGNEPTPCHTTTSESVL